MLSTQPKVASETLTQKRLIIGNLHSWQIYAKHSYAKSQIWLSIYWYIIQNYKKFLRDHYSAWNRYKISSFQLFSFLRLFNLPPTWPTKTVSFFGCVLFDLLPVVHKCNPYPSKVKLKVVGRMLPTRLNNSLPIQYYLIGVLNLLKQTWNLLLLVGKYFKIPLYKWSKKYVLIFCLNYSLLLFSFLFLFFFYSYTHTKTKVQYITTFKA